MLDINILKERQVDTFGCYTGRYIWLLHQDESFSNGGSGYYWIVNIAISRVSLGDIYPSTDSVIWS